MAGVWLIKENIPVHADAMIILMGSIADRILQSVDNYNQGLTGKVIIVEAGMGAYKTLDERGVRIISNTKQTRNAAITLGIPSDSIIILPGDATSTQMEATIVRDYLANKPAIDTLLIVSSSPHTRRAYLIFKYAFRKSDMPVQVVCSPSSYTNFDAEKWWKSREDVQIVLSEYIKIAIFMMFERRKL